MSFWKSFQDEARAAVAVAHPLHHHAGQRPSSGSASASGSPSDPGFMSLDEYGSSPGDVRAFCSHRSNTPESIAETPPAKDGSGSELYGYMTMDRPLSHCGRPYRRVSGDGAQDLDRGLRKRTYSLTTPARQRAVPQPSSASLDEYTLMRATFSGSSGRLCPSCPTSSPRVAYHPYPEDYGDIEIGSHRSSSSNLGTDDGYMPMTPGAALMGGGSGSCKSDDYMPMSPTSVSAPKQILHPRVAAAALPTTGPAAAPAPTNVAGRAFPVNRASYKASSPAESSPEDSGYMRMWCGSKLPTESTDSKQLPNGDYLNMSPSDAGTAGTPPDFFTAALHGAGEMLRSVPGYCYSSLPRSYKAPYTCNGDNDQYVLMSSPVGRILEEERLEPQASVGTTHLASSVVAGVGGGSHAQPPHSVVPSAGRQSGSSSSRPEGFLSQRCRAVRPTRLSLEGLQTLPSMHECPPPPEPKSPGEYINIDFGEAGARLSPPAPPMMPQPPLPQQARPWTPSQPGGLVGCPGGSGSPMRRETSAGFQNGLNYIAIDVRDEPGLLPSPQQHPHLHPHPQPGDKSAWGRTRSLGGLISTVGAGSTGGVCGGPGPGALPSNTYASIDFLSHHLKEATIVKGLLVVCKSEDLPGFITTTSHIRESHGKEEAQHFINI
ncbi:Insulin receptor substrate 2 [Myotis brandtii]|uniref:Insulin receptor substrate 2 n=1 Tax=Myotis brandtii TaxID=109478 RepID=S7NQV2_MYOBR|nr:Insulin receptor substrate 2 [Myotis brandtii]